MNAISFTKSADRWLSGNITAAKSNMVIHVKFPSRIGDIRIERSITGADWVACGLVRGDEYGSNVLEFNVSGLVPGQMLRISSSAEIEGGYLE